MEKFVLVTGGAGFIGSNLCNALLKNNYRVRVLDNLSTGNIDYLPKDPNLEFINGDITDSNTCLNACKDVSGVFHLAAMSKVLPSLLDNNMINFCTEVNVKGTLNILNACKTQPNPPKLIYSASSTCYGSRPIPHSENTHVDCTTPYSLTKHIGEQYCEFYSKFYNLKTIRLRYFMVYGPNEPCVGNYAIVTGIFLKNKAENKPLNIHGDGSQTRDFIHVTDVVNATILAYESDLTDITLNIGSGKNYSIKKLANWISTDQIHTESRDHDLKDTLADISLVKEKLGWKPKYDFKKCILNRSDIK